MTTTTLTGHVAGLADGSEQVISGVAVGVGDVTRGLSGDRKIWTADELRAAAASLEGTPVNPLHSEQTVGEVIRAGFEPDRGILYEAELEDPSLASQAANGHLEVSIEARHADGGTVETDHGEAMLATDIQFTGLSLVQRGAAPSASASVGKAAALSATAIHEALFDPVKHPRNPETGKFVERPYPVPDDVADMETADIVSDLADRDPNFAAKIDGLDIGLSDETREQALSESSAFDTDITQKSTEELEDLREFLMKKHSEARDAQDPAARAQGKTDTQMDKLMKSALEKTREIDGVLRSRRGA